jgi:hypothetical protein
MSLRVQVSAVIDRPVAEVFHFYAYEHVRNHPRWDPDMQLEQVSDGPIGVGTIIHRRNTHSGTPIEGTMQVVEFEPNRAFGVVIHDGASETRGWVTFQAESEECDRSPDAAKRPKHKASDRVRDLGSSYKMWRTLPRWRPLSLPTG